MKYRLGKLTLDLPPHEYVPLYRRLHQILTLPLDKDSTLQLRGLPDLHRDPFDRILICQAIHHGLALLTPDPDVHQYPVRVEW